MTAHSQGELFSDALIAQIKSRFHYVDHDMSGRERLFFDNAGGSFRLKAAVEQFALIDALPDCPERIHELAIFLQQVQARGSDDLRTILNARGGSVYASLTASGAMFDMVRAIAENVPGKNMVTTALEHPSSFDAMSLYAGRTGKQLRVAPSNPVTGGVDVDAIVRLVDQDTCLLSVIYASNISGAKLDVSEIVKRARAIKPDLYIVVDAVQHAPHGLIDLQQTPVDGINIAPYKFFGCRGSGMSWVSERAAVLPHHKLAGKKKDFWDLGSAAPWQFAVVTAIVDYVCWLGGQFVDSDDRRARFASGIEKIELHERALLARLLDGTAQTPGLRAMDGVQVFLDFEDLTKRDLILAIGIDNLEHAQAVREYEKRGVIVYERVASSLYSKRMLDSFGLEGAVRVSPLHCNSAADIDRFLRVTREIGEAFAAAPAR
ncbi:aminotransferase class V-fold PLP-dependent enzyme [Variovorax ginsengisoli]|uniref:Aminotransferase class V-fold PLP-dependent enzyme n=1 Tax=Variovorax ginsengisoli TaxID=363844 RepID=A0ABT8RXS8_9BURK|nr:aminotransferase class V-fold PLP-dependent enzyme [Variovorax ginsengisoli]MDN8612311.1 aminotransferase class V-fold PLP-dependent enzyme [Variovorax ginsengisoli]MDO1531481.1 aminotransferase class V-fold PLP-dependent enzyme [Variovorax ginsengisoli]